MKVKTFGPVDERSLAQLERCMEAGEAEYGVLCADHHPGYSQPIGGGIAYEGYVSPAFAASSASHRPPVGRVVLLTIAAVHLPLMHLSRADGLRRAGARWSSASRPSTGRSLRARVSCPSRR